MSNTLAGAWRVLAALTMVTGCLLVLAAGPARAEFGVVSFTGGVFDQAGASFTRAGGHPDSATTTFELTAADLLLPDGSMKKVDVELPPGFIGNPGAIARQCPMRDLYGSTVVAKCPASSQVGTARLMQPAAPGVNLFSANIAAVYNLEPPPGYPAALGFNINSQPVLLLASLRAGSDYGITISATDVSQGLFTTGARVTIWGVPGDPSHDADRGTSSDAGMGDNVNCASTADPLCTNPGLGPGEEPKAFLSNPADCAAGVLETRLRARSWENPDEVKTAAFSIDTNGNPTAVDGCEGASFDPSMSLTPTTRQADSPAGLDVDLTMPTLGLTDPDAAAEAHLKRVTVTLPEGMSVNPSSADGLGACSGQQIGLIEGGADPRFTPEPDRCPERARIGTVEVRTPLLKDSLLGSVYLGAQGDNPFGTLLSLYIAVDDPVTGTVLKLPGRIDADPRTGRLTATFDNNPQIPFSSLRLRFKAGPRAPLITPRACGTYGIVSKLSSWSAADPDNPAPEEIVTKTSSFQITSGPGGSPCPSPNEFDSSFEAGTVAPIAGSYSPLVVNASRPDASGVLSGLELDLPPGLTGKLAGIAYCPDAALAAASGKDGAAEQASSSCPAASKLGTVDVGAGAGPTPYHVQGTAYLAGPYKGAPISIAVITPAVAGPFDLGTVVVRAKADVDPHTAQIHVSSDPLPTILRGIPLKVRSISIDTDRPEFTLNPTNCEPMSISGLLLSPTALAPVASPFQVGACKALDFRPSLKLSFKGGTTRSKHPALKSVLTYPSKGDFSNITRAAVILPHSEIIDQFHVGNPCTRPQFAEEKCPKISVLGRAKAWTPLLDEPLEGKVYFRANGGERELPDIVADLRGQIHIELVGAVDTVTPKRNARIRTTFFQVPDAPVSRFVLELKGGKEGLLENSQNLCRSPQRAVLRLTAHNNKTYDTEPTIANGCGKKAKRTARPSGRSGASHR